VLLRNHMKRKIMDLVQFLIYAICTLALFALAVFHRRLGL